MRSKSNKVYSLAQVAKLLHRSKSTVYNYVIVGLIKVSPDARVGRAGRTVTEAEYLRLKRDGVDPTGVKDGLIKHGAIRKPAKKKQVRRSASKTAAKASAKKRVKRKAAATVAKKQVKRGAAASGKSVKKKTRRSAAAKKGKR